MCYQKEQYFITYFGLAKWGVVACGWSWCGDVGEGDKGWCVCLGSGLYTLKVGTITLISMMTRVFKIIIITPVCQKEHNNTLKRPMETTCLKIFIRSQLTNTEK